MRPSIDRRCRNGRRIASLCALLPFLAGGCALWIPADPDCDVDGDGFPAQGCASSQPFDCVDTDPGIHPGHAEQPYDAIDQDCVDGDLEDVDQDGARSIRVGGSDCRDDDPTIGPGAIEIPYDRIDQDCTGSDLVDVDGDGSVAAEAGGPDCDDEDGKIHPGAVEVGDNSVDENCDGSTCSEEVPYDGQDNDCIGGDLEDIDEDGFVGVQAEGGDDCNDYDADVHPEAEEQRCDGIDQDCTGKDLIDADGDGVSGCGSPAPDCDDESPAVRPGAAEIPCDGIDQDCDGQDARDQDGDGYAPRSCAGGMDCNDSAPGIHPGTPEIPYDGIDQDCSGEDLTDVDGDGQESVLAGGADCYDDVGTVYPGSTLQNPLQPADAEDNVLVAIPPGEFMMGTAGDPAAQSAQPLHRVQLSGYCIEAYEVTNARYRACMADPDPLKRCPAPLYPSSYSRANYLENPEYSSYPVVFVDYDAAAAFCAWAGRRLPTEAQWEKAARGGCDLKGAPDCDEEDEGAYPWGDTLPTCSDVPPWLNFGGCIADPAHPGTFADTTAVGAFPRGMSPYGVFDMAGNVAEVVADYYGPYEQSYFREGVQVTVPVDPTGPSSGTYRVVRGGAMQSGATEVTLYRREYGGAGAYSLSQGFRCAYAPTVPE